MVSAVFGIINYDDDDDKETTSERKEKDRKQPVKISNVGLTLQGAQATQIVRSVLSLLNYHLHSLPTS